MLPDFVYDDTAHLLDHIASSVVDPVRRWEEAVDSSSARERRLREIVRDKEAEIAALKAE